MATDLRVLLGTSPLAPNGEAYEMYKLQTDLTYAKAVYAYVADTIPLRVQIPSETPISAKITQTATDPALRVTLEGQTLYSVATPTMDGLMSSTDKKNFDTLNNTFKVDSGGGAAYVSVPFSIRNDNAAAGALADFTARSVDRAIRLTAYSSTHGGRANQVWVNATTASTALVFGVNNAEAGRFDIDGIFKVGNTSYVSEYGWRSLNGLHFTYDPATGTAANPWVKIGNFPTQEGAIVFEVITITDYNYEGFNTAEVCVKRFQPGSGSMSANIKPTSENDSGIYFGFNTNGDLFLKCTVNWGSIASYRIKFSNVGFTPQTPAIFAGTVTHEIGSPAGFLKNKRIAPA